MMQMYSYTQIPKNCGSKLLGFQGIGSNLNLHSLGAQVYLKKKGIFLQKSLKIQILSLFFFFFCVQNYSYSDEQKIYCNVCFSKNNHFKLEGYTLVKIKKGMSIFDIVNKLYKKKVIENKFFFFVLAFFKDVRKKLKSGKYQMPMNVPLVKILNILVEGKSITHKISIPEGITSKKVLQITNSHPCLSGEEIKELEEGGILPGTYFFSDKELKENIIKRMKASLKVFLDKLFKKYVSPPQNLSCEKVVILASIIEKETSIPEEKSIISGVFFNRMKIGMRLQADPTVIYGIKLKQGKLGRALTRKDLKFKSPYNTYINKGLPPTPICCPGEESIKAVFNAAPSNFLYFVAYKKGRHVFSRNLREHNIKTIKVHRKK
jgi:UPF0755 protein